MKRLLLLTAALVVLIGATAQATSPAPKVVGQSDSGRTVALAPGQELRIRLSVCSSCGYHWQIERAPDKAVLTRLKQRRQASNCRPPCVGGNEVTIFRYRARAAGTTTLRLGYIPPGGRKATKQFRLRVRVGS